MDNNDLITEARGLCEKATPGPWEAGSYGAVCLKSGFKLGNIEGSGNADFIARSRTLIPELCDALEKAQEQNKQLLHEVCTLACESVEREKTLARLEAEVLAMRDSVRWIPVTERLPEEPYGCLVIVEQDDYWGEPREVMYPHFAGYDGEQWNDGDGDKVPLEITHWMPLPAAPEEGDKL